MNAQDKYIDIKGLRLHYLDWGNRGGQPMLLLHGFTGHAHVWDDFAAVFKGHYHVIALDQRGHGESQWSQECDYTLDAHFSDIAGFVDALDLNDIVLIGHSMGGRNALYYAACAPERVQKLIVVDSRLETKIESNKALMNLLTSFPTKADSLDQVVKALQRLYTYVPIRSAYHISKYGYKQTKPGAYTPKYDTRMGLKSEKADYSVENIGLFLKNISCPTLIVRGEKSPFLSREDARKIGKRIPDAVFSEISKATHMPVQENLEAFKAVVHKFLGGYQI